MKIELGYLNPGPGASSEELSKVILARFGLLPRKKDAKAGFHSLLFELYERKKEANRSQNPEKAVMSVEEMGAFAGIKRQTMYDYLNRWLMLQIIKKTSFVKNKTVIMGYELNGSNLENAFRKAETIVKDHVEQSLDLIKELQNEIKKDKLKENFRQTPEESD